jgi:hypothetical protein
VKNQPIVLVCEDDPLVRMVIVDYLIDNDCAVIEAAAVRRPLLLSMAQISNSMSYSPTFAWVVP